MSGVQRFSRALAGIKLVRYSHQKLDVGMVSLKYIMRILLCVPAGDVLAVRDVTLKGKS